MAWQGDDQLEALLRELESAGQRARGPPKTRSGSIDQVLDDIVALTYADARALAEPNRMAGLEL